MFLAMAQFIGCSFRSHALRNIIERRKPQACEKSNNNIIGLQGSKALTETRVGASFLRAQDFGMTNSKMPCANNPAMNSLKSSRFFCTMFFGGLIARLETMARASMLSTHNTLARQTSNKRNKSCQVGCIVPGSPTLVRAGSKSSAAL